MRLTCACVRISRHWPALPFQIPAAFLEAVRFLALLQLFKSTTLNSAQKPLAWGGKPKKAATPPSVFSGADSMSS